MTVDKVVALAGTERISLRGVAYCSCGTLGTFERCRKATVGSWIRVLGNRAPRRRVGARRHIQEVRPTVVLELGIKGKRRANPRHISQLYGDKGDNHAASACGNGRAGACIIRGIIALAVRRGSRGAWR